MTGPTPVEASQPDLEEDAAAARRPQRFSLRNRVTLLVAFCVAGVVALISLGAFFTVRDSLYEQVDSNLIDRASQAASGPRVLAPDVQSVPAAFYAAANLKISLLYSNGHEVIGGGDRKSVV